MEVLEFSTNPFRGAVTSAGSLPSTPAEFALRLRHSLEVWGSEGLQTVWMEIPLRLATLIPIAVEAGFSFHHSSEQYLMLTHRLVPDAHIPPFATHYIGAGGVDIGAVWSGIPAERYLPTLACPFFLNNCRTISNLIFSGLLDRFPTQKFVSVESCIGWIPFMLQAI